MRLLTEVRKNKSHKIPGEVMKNDRFAISGFHKVKHFHVKMNKNVYSVILIINYKWVLYPNSNEKLWAITT